MSNAPHSYQAPRTIVVTGATGMIGSALVERLRANGHTVRRLVRSSAPQQPDDILWDPARGILPTSGIDGAYAVVHLAGAPIAQRWTAQHKKDIRESRMLSTALVARTIAAATTKPAVLLSGSAIGYYGNRGDEQLDESSQPGSDFLAHVVRDWEAAAAPAAAAGTRAVLLRTGIVLSPKGGALERLLVPFRMGVGGPIGGGDQWMSWIALEDHLRAMEFALFDEGLSGAANLVAPNPVTNATFASTLGRVLNRPALIPVPGIALELLYGEMARATLLSGQRVRPAALSSAGFEFRFPTLEQALRHELVD
jgi:TIGR01777 family protein